jgi:methylenetetrahydrofolate reductase (NADPH)
MKVTEYLNKATEPLFSFEILPPLKGQSIDSIFNSIEPLMEFNPMFIDVTYHRQEFIYKKHSNGLLEKISVRKRPGTVGICAAIMNKYKIDAIPHLICGGFTKEETENALIDLNFLGIDNILALRGDAIKTERTFIPEENGHNYAIDLLEQVVDMNKGHYLDQSSTDKSYHTDFCIGVAGYPEKHFEAPNMDIDLMYLKQKVDAGADYIVTQMFFDNTKFFEFVAKCREIGIKIPIIPGIKPFTSKSQLTIIPSLFHIDLPTDLVEMVNKAKTDADVKAIGIEWGIKQVKELIANNIPAIHFYTMGKSESTKAIAKEVF